MNNSEEDIRQMIIGYCWCCGSDELLVLNGIVTCLACKEEYAVELFFKDGLPRRPEDMPPASGDASMEARCDPCFSPQSSLELKLLLPLLILVSLALSYIVLQF